MVTRFRRRHVRRHRSLCRIERATSAGGTETFPPHPQHQHSARSIAADIDRAAEFVAESLRAAGMENVEIIPTGSTRWSMPTGCTRPASRPFCATATTTFSRPIRWNCGRPRRSSPPFATATSTRAESADDKGQMYMHVKAVEALRAVNGTLPVNVKFLIEGEEEVGGDPSRSTSPRIPKS